MASMIDFISNDGVILRYDTVSQSNPLVPYGLEINGFHVAVMAGDGYIYLISCSSNPVMRFNPSDGSTTFIGGEFDGNFNLRGAVLEPDGNVYGIPYYFNYILKIDVATQSTSLLKDQTLDKVDGNIIVAL